MADDPKHVGRTDRDRINVNQPHELRDWSKNLGVSEEELRAAVAKVGDSAERVKQHLSGRS